MRTECRKTGRRWNMLLAASLMFTPLSVSAQPSPELKGILERLEKLEAANRSLTEEVHSLRAQLAGAAAETIPNGERISVVEARVEEQAQSKVEAAQRFPLRVTGMALFNSFLNSSENGGAQYPTVASAGAARSGGAGFRQTIIGLEYRGPQTVWGGKVRGAVSMDFFGGSGQVLDQLFRIRTASVGVDWAQRSVTVGLEKPLVAQRDPTSLAQVGVSPLTGAGNLWLWTPQIRIEQGISFGAQDGVRAQFAVVQTREQSPKTVAGYTSEAEKSRPGIEGRLAFHYGSERRIEIAPAFHYSVSHVDYASVPSSIFAVDWFMNPLKPVEFSGTFFTGENVAILGTGGAGGGYNDFGPYRVAGIHSQGGWGQLTWRPTQRFSINGFTGRQDNQNSQLTAGQVGKNILFGANVFYRLAPNVLISFESSQIRTTRVGSGRLLTNHYDLALAYLF
jgi:hypothetical protein